MPYPKLQVLVIATFYIHNSVVNCWLSVFIAQLFLVLNEESPTNTA
jgi:hypothetical protein